MLKTERGLPTIAAAPPSHYDRAVLQLALLAPEIQQAILAGRHPHHFSPDTFNNIGLPMLWSCQRELLGFKD